MFLVFLYLLKNPVKKNISYKIEVGLSKLPLLTSMKLDHLCGTRVLQSDCEVFINFY